MPRKKSSDKAAETESAKQEEQKKTRTRKTTTTAKKATKPAAKRKVPEPEEIMIQPEPEEVKEKMREEIEEIQNAGYDDPDEIMNDDSDYPESESESESDSDSESEQESEQESGEARNGTRSMRPGHREMVQHPKPKYTYAMLSSRSAPDLRKLAKELNVNAPVTMRKDDLIISLLRAQAESMNYRFGGGTLEILPENFGFLRPKGMLPTDSDVYLSSSQIRRFGLRNGDVIWGLIRPPRDQEHYEALLRVETVNFSDPEHSRRRPMFAQLTPIFPDRRLSLEYDSKDLATRLVDMFAPIGFGQRALIVSPPKAGKTTLLKRIAQAIASNSPDIIIMALLIDERPEEVTDIARSIDGEVIASTFDRPADEHIRVANLALEKAKRLVEAKRDVVILLDSITRLARASNLTVPPSGRTLSGGLDPSGLYFPKRFFGAARNFEEGGSLTIIGTALTDTGSRMDDVIYEEFKGTGNMELHLSRKLAEQRIFPAIDITKSGTRREELLMPDDELKRLWILRKRIAGVDEAGALNLILDKLRQTENNNDFLSSIKLA
ncbi:MAG: transcription termination factor Rho [Synergistaceae bacterium]|nr:transcription termination factor Rho [Synergistaceae bacterium]MBQ6112318.1 transcription termination factor Rho [Synergistaceae bacterium]MBR0250352.1 transcription termination factor Rho [Synergistaceae bacterium]